MTSLSILRIALGDECDEVRERAVSFHTYLIDNIPDTISRPDRRRGGGRGDGLDGGDGLEDEEDEYDDEYESSDEDEEKVLVDEGVEEMLSHLYTDKVF